MPNPKPKKIVLLSGWGFSSSIWNFFTKDFSADYIHINILDLLQTTNKLTTETIYSEIEKKIPTDALIMGWSLGGLIGLDFCLRYPEKAIALVTMACSPKFVAEENWPGISQQKIDRLYKQIEQDIESASKRFITEIMFPNKNISIKQILANACLIKENYRQPLLFLLDFLATTDKRHSFQKLKIPSLHLLGNQDMLVPSKVGAELKQYHPNANIEIIENAGHALFLTHTQSCWSKIHSFINCSF